MKYVMTFWTAGQRPETFGCGWSSVHQHYYSWTLSSNLASMLGPVELYTDSAGAEFLGDVLRLPFAKIHVTLDGFNRSSALWGAAKVDTYSRQREPFIHLDSDVFLWKPLPQSILEAGVSVQSIEDKMHPNWATIYGPIRELMVDSFAYLPDVYRDEAACDTAYNVGIIGGSNLDAIGEYCQAVNRIIDAEENRDGWQKVDHGSGLVNISLEQLTAGVTLKPCKPVELFALGDSSELGFTHVMGAKKKMHDSRDGHRLADRVRMRYPYQYAAVHKAISEGGMQRKLPLREELNRPSIEEILRQNKPTFREAPHIAMRPPVVASEPPKPSGDVPIQVIATRRQRGTRGGCGCGRNRA